MSCTNTTRVSVCLCGWRFCFPGINMGKKRRGQLPGPGLGRAGTCPGARPRGGDAFVSRCRVQQQPGQELLSLRSQRCSGQAVLLTTQALCSPCQHHAEPVPRWAAPPACPVCITGSEHLHPSIVSSIHPPFPPSAHLEAHPGISNLDLMRR